MTDSSAPEIVTSEVVDHGSLPAWERGDLPEPLPFSLINLFKTIGPGAILLAAAIGGGEWIVGPLTTIKYGRGILWVASIGIVLQTIFNLEAARYTMYTGEPIITGFMRLRPGSRWWAWFYILIGTAQLATPALAAGSAAVLFAASHHRLPDGSDSGMLGMIAVGIILFAVILLMSGKSIELVLERLSWAMILFIFSFLILANVLFVPSSDWIATAQGFLVPQGLPDNVDIILLASFAATAGSGGLGNLAISNWFRDKGFGMGACVGGIQNVLAGDDGSGHSALKPVGVTFPITSDNVRRWKTWWRYAVIDQTALWGFGCICGMFLNVNLAVAIIPPAEVAKLSGYAAGTFQAEYMSRLWNGFWILALLNGFWILFSTHLGNTDVLVRTVSDICWAGFPSVRRFSVSKLYAALLGLLTVWAVISVHFGSVLDLFKILAVIANPIMAVAAVQILRVNLRFLPREIRPPLWRQLGLVLCAVLYGGMTLALLWDSYSKWTTPQKSTPLPAAKASK